MQCVDGKLLVDNVQGAAQSLHQSGLLGKAVNLATEGMEAWFQQAWPEHGRTTQTGEDEAHLPAANLSLAQLREAKWHARLAAAAYALDEEDLKSQLRALGCRMRSFSKQDPEQGNPPQWFTCKRSNGELIVAFRGTGSVADAFTDIDVAPTDIEGPSGAQVHSGFLNALHKSWWNGLHLDLTRAAISAAPSVTIVGHSLGGALALTLAAGDLLPVASPGKYRVVTFGAPAVFYGRQPRMNALRNAVVSQWVLDDDPIPRLLGSDFTSLSASKPLMSVGSIGAEKAGVEDKEWWKVLSTIMRIGGDVGEHAARYRHLDSATVYWLRSRNAFLVPQEQRRDLLRYQGVLSIPVKGFAYHPYFAYLGAIGHLIDRETRGSQTEL